MSEETKGHPIRLRLPAKEKGMVADIANSTGLQDVDVIRLACKFALPKILSGEVSLADIGGVT